jgi:hypothetical protein
VILGGTSHHSYDKNIDYIESKRIFDDCAELLPELKNSNIIKHDCNTRPCRSTLRIEQENFITDNGKVFPVVHQYGHGGCGISMWYFSFIY